MGPPKEEFCKTYVSVSRRHEFKKLVLFFPSFEHSFCEAFESHQNLNSKDVHINLRQKQFTAHVCMNKKSSQPVFYESGRHTIKIIGLEAFKNRTHGC